MISFQAFSLKACRITDYCYRMNCFNFGVDLLKMAAILDFYSVSYRPCVIQCEQHMEVSPSKC